VGQELAAAHERALQAGTDGGRGAPRILAATKYVALADMPILAEAGVELVGENRAQDLQEKFAAHGDLFEWHFIGQLQSRKVRVIVAHVSMIHSVASDSALRELERHRDGALPGLRILVEVNLAGEGEKAGIDPESLDEFIARSPLPVAGLMTMPPLSEDPEASRPWFASLRRLADERGLEHLSMGTSQDYQVAAQEGATIVRIGTGLYRP
jgi:pyridoxal phosphate enzyme (YggS family)